MRIGVTHISNFELYNGDCLQVMDELIEQGVKVDMVLCDLPFGVTKYKWDVIIPFDEMWDKIHKITKPCSAILLFGNEPFSSALRLSNKKNYKYDWVWKKTKAQGFLNAKKMPLKDYECISTFYQKPPTYNPQGLIEGDFNNFRPSKLGKGEDVYGTEKEFGASKYTNYPKQIIEFANVSSRNNVHPTQKPVELLEYLIKTYTNEGELILDFTMGSGSTGVACRNTNRQFIGIELDEKYFKIAQERIGA